MHTQDPRCELRRRGTAPRGGARLPLADNIAGREAIAGLAPEPKRPEVDQRRQNICQESAACRVQPDIAAADQKAVIAVAKLCRAGVGRKHTQRVNWGRSPDKRTSLRNKSVKQIGDMTPPLIRALRASSNLRNRLMTSAPEGAEVGRRSTVHQPHT
jgi:hypothetical protein